MSTECIFCKIVRGELPSSKVYEDDDILAFIDIGPIVKGHTLVIPKQHFDPLTATPPETLCKIIKVVQKVAAAQLALLKADGINITQANGTIAGQVVPHIHFHVIPRFQNDQHSWNWNAGKYDSTTEAQEYAAKIASGIKEA